MKRFLSVFLLVFTLLAVLVACGGGEEPEATMPAPTAEAVVEPTPLPEPTEEPTPAGPTAETSFQDAINATIQIEANGSFQDPEFGLQLNTAGRGSGFIIDPSGIAVTNNHVVTGAAFLEVYVPGTARPFNARVLGVSECSDLAVIDIEGDGFRFLEWNNEPVRLGTTVYALGYPLGDPRPSLTNGVVSKESADGETSWASVDEVLEHSATINPGNSGGPLVTADGRVVGVNYAGLSSANQYFAINAADTRALVEQLIAGNNVTSIGVNGEAVMTGDGDTGIWVASVQSGSPADRVGVEPGDIITKLEGLVLSTDGTMADYCDILRSRNATDPMDIEVLRYATQEFLEGQLNGPELVQSFSFAQVVETDDLQQGSSSDPGNGGSGSGGSATYQNYVGIYDDSGALYVEVPAEWNDIDGSNWLDDTDGTVLGSELMASTDLAGFSSNYTTPGVQIIASAGLAGQDMGSLVDFFDFTGSCILDGRYDFDDPVFPGVYDLYYDCDGQGSVIIVLAAEPTDRSFATIVLVQAVYEADLDALDHVLNTFNVVGQLPGQ